MTQDSEVRICTSPVRMHRKTEQAGPCRQSRNELVYLEFVYYITENTICNVMKNEIRLQSVKRGCISQEGAEFAAVMEDVLGYITLLHDSDRAHNIPD